MDDTADPTGPAGDRLLRSDAAAGESVNTQKPLSCTEGGLSLSNDDQARPANSRVSVETLMRSPSLIKRGTRISRPVSSFADFVTLPLAVSPREPGSV